jgi:hypothetical protein
MAAQQEYSTLDLRQMDRATAERELNKLQFDRWEQLHDLMDSAEETRERFEREDEQVQDLVVRADPEELGTPVDIYDNDLLVRIDSDDEGFRGAIETLDDEFSEEELDNPTELDGDDRDRMADLICDVLDAVILRWNGTDWNELRADQRRAVLADARAQWGFDGLFLALVDIIAAVREDREQRVDVIDSFRQPERRGNR